MKPTLNPGLRRSFCYKAPENKKMPYTYPETPIILAMPKVFATGFMIVVMEWTCAQLLNQHIGDDDLSRLAATPPRMTVKVDVEVVEAQGRKVVFKVSAHDDMDLIGEGRHERVVALDKFNAKVAEKAKSAAELV